MKDTKVVEIEEEITEAKDIKLQTKHLFKILKVVNKTGVLNDIKGLYAKTVTVKKGASKEEIESAQSELGLDIVIAILGGLDLAEKEIYELLADLEGKTVKQIESQDPNLTVESLKAILTSDVLKNFLASVTA